MDAPLTGCQSSLAELSGDESRQLGGGLDLDASRGLEENLAASSAQIELKLATRVQHGFELLTERKQRGAIVGARVSRHGFRRPTVSASLPPSVADSHGGASDRSSRIRALCPRSDNGPWSGSLCRKNGVYEARPRVGVRLREHDERHGRRPHHACFRDREIAIAAVVVTPHRFRTIRQFWSYCGLGNVM